MSTYGAYLVETLVTLVAVCGLAFFVLWGARRVGLGRPSGPLEFRGHLPLDARRGVYLVKVADRVFVIGVGDGGMTKLGEMAASELPLTAPGEPRSFARALSRVLARAQPTTPASKGPSDGRTDP